MDGALVKSRLDFGIPGPGHLRVLEDWKKGHSDPPLFLSHKGNHLLTLIFLCLERVGQVT